MSFTAFTMFLSRSLHDCLVSGGYNLQPVDLMQFTNPTASSQSHPFPGDLQCLPLLTWNNSSIIQHFSESDVLVAPWLWICSYQRWKWKGFAPLYILVKGCLLCRRTRERESLPQRASHCRAGRAAMGRAGCTRQWEAWQLRKESSAPLCMTINHSFLSCTVVPKIVGLWHMTSDHIFGKMYFKGGCIPLVCSSKHC